MNAAAVAAIERVSTTFDVVNNDDDDEDDNIAAAAAAAAAITSSAKQKASLTYVDYGGAVEPRSFGRHRIPGDVQAHYGGEARMALIQMLTNRLAESMV